MKTLPALLAGIALLVGCGDGGDGADDHDVLNDLDDPKPLDKILGEALPDESVQFRGPEGAKLAYAPNSQVPYTGWAKRMYDSGQVMALGYYKDGKAEGLWTVWHKNGQKAQEAPSKDGKAEGLWTMWDEDGKKKEESTYRDGKKEGLRTVWHDNGQKEQEGHFKDGKAEGLHTIWDENGKELYRIRYKDGWIIKD